MSAAQGQGQDGKQISGPGGQGEDAVPDSGQKWSMAGMWLVRGTAGHLPWLPCLGLDDSMQ